MRIVQASRRISGAFHTEISTNPAGVDPGCARKESMRSSPRGARSSRRLIPPKRRYGAPIVAFVPAPLVPIPLEGLRRLDLSPTNRRAREWVRESNALAAFEREMAESNAAYRRTGRAAIYRYHPPVQGPVDQHVDRRRHGDFFRCARLAGRPVALAFDCSGGHGSASTRRRVADALALRYQKEAETIRDTYLAHGMLPGEAEAAAWGATARLHGLTQRARSSTMQAARDDLRS